jgi:signal transduction histidine kinase
MYRQLFFWTFLFLIPSLAMSQTWGQDQKSKTATLDVYWFTSVPFIYEEQGQLKGLEYDLLMEFSEYLHETHGVELSIRWIEAESFHSILDIMKNPENPNILGTSAFSITEDRKQYLNFSEAYLPDITVLVTGQGTPIAKTYQELKEMLDGRVAVTIKGTNYENLLQNLKDQLNIDFETLHIHSDQNVLDNIAEDENRFGFIDLPIYLMLIKKGGDLTRQNLYNVRGTGYGVTMPKSSDWQAPFNQFLSDARYHEKVGLIISRYLGAELYEFIENLYGGTEIGTSILTKEKELQLALIKNANLKLQKDRNVKRVLILGITFVSIFLGVIGFLFFKNRRNTRLLVMQKDQIEEQQKDIRQKNEQLMNRNMQLIALNEEKNVLMKVFAHDLRSPLGHIIGLSDFLNAHAEQMSEEDKELLTQIGTGAKRINQMISKILDVEVAEGARSIVLREQVDITQITQDIVSRYRAAAAQKSIEIELMHRHGDQIIETDHMLLFLVLENLVSNAVKFSNAKTRVRLETDRQEGAVLFKVCDQGPGFSEEDRSLLFNRFQKLSAKPTGGEQSIGLGLSIVKKYVGDLGGKVWLETPNGTGSTFIVSLPV